MTWQPIETAPKDGTDVLLAFTKFANTVINQGFYAQDGRDLWVLGGSLVYEVSLEMNKGVKALIAVSPKSTTPFAPTYWQPLPEPPEATP